MPPKEDVRRMTRRGLLVIGPWAHPKADGIDQLYQASPYKKNLPC